MSDISDCIIKILADNGVSVEQIDIWKDNGLVRNVKNIIELDFSEHDKAFADEIETLKEKLLNTTKIAEQNRRESFVLKIKNQDLKNITKGYEDKIAELEKEVVNYKQAFEDKCKDYDFTSELLNKFGTENESLKQRIAELENRKTENFDEAPDSITIDGYKCEIIKTESGLYISRDEIYSIIDKEKEPLKQQCKELEDRHQSDCIEINRLNTTIDVLIHKVEYLRRLAGLE